LFDLASPILKISVIIHQLAVTILVHRDVRRPVALAGAASVGLVRAGTGEGTGLERTSRACVFCWCVFALSA
jgi:hypothetical protein